MQKEEAEQAANNQIYFDRINMRKMIYADLATHCGEIEAAALQYLTGPTRGLTAETIKSFGIFSISNPTKTDKYFLSETKRSFNVVQSPKAVL